MSLTARGISDIARRICREQSGAGRLLQIYRPYICPFEELLPHVPEAADILDVGCGALRGGIHFVRYLEPGHYCGLDINGSLLEAGRRELAAEGLAERAPELIEDADFEVARFGRRFEWGMAQSVFTHLPMNLVIVCLAKVRAVLSSGGRFYATFFRAPHPACLETLVHQPGGAQTQYHRDIFHYAAEEMEWMGRVAGLEADIVGDWGHPRAQQLVVYRRA